MAEPDPALPEQALVHIVDYDEAVRDALAALLRIRGFRVQQHASALAFLEALPAVEPGCILTDVMMPHVSGIALLKRLREAGIDWPVIVMSGRTTRRMGAEATALGAAAVLQKPFDPAEVVAAIRRLTGGAVG